MSFLTDGLFTGTDWRTLERAVSRVMFHCGWSNVVLVGRTGDMGADILAVRDDGNGRRMWVVQVKAVTGGKYVGISAIDEAISALSAYGAKTVAVATNGDFTRSAFRRRDQLASNGYDVKLWNGKFLRELLSQWPLEFYNSPVLREYQEKIVSSLERRISSGGRAGQFIMATGLGKTVVAASLVRRLFEKGYRNALVVCHSQDLALQLERAFWPFLKSSEATSIVFEGKAPKTPVGVTFGLYQTLLGYLSSVDPEQYDLVIVDESHHVLASNYLACIEHLKPKFLLGMTATPWRGDKESIDKVFGEPVAKVSLVDGMTMGYLAEVDYRILSDNINWDEVPKLSKNRLTIRDLNRRLFLPQRDEAAVSKIVSTLHTIKSPKLIVFSPSIDHAEYIARMLSVAGIPTRNISGLDRFSRQKLLMDFAAGRLKGLSAVDVLNEGIDVPDVNTIAFMRATHSRRIFVQQLGRGLRLAPGKEKVVVLDFVSDIRRIADVMSMNSEARGAELAPEALYLKDGFVRFDDGRTGTFVEEWLKDIADLGEENDSFELTFPSMK